MRSRRARDAEQIEDIESGSAGVASQHHQILRNNTKSYSIPRVVIKDDV